VGTEQGDVIAHFPNVNENLHGEFVIRSDLILKDGDPPLELRDFGFHVHEHLLRALLPLSNSALLRAKVQNNK
jgi:hypothetical protein